MICIVLLSTLYQGHPTTVQECYNKEGASIGRYIASSMGKRIIIAPENGQMEKYLIHRANLNNMKRELVK